MSKGKKRFGGSGKPKTCLDWIQPKNWVYPPLIESGKFETKEDLNIYFSGDKLVCLECGVERVFLVAHLKVHKLNALQYKEKYNIPKSRPLCGQDLLRTKSKIMKNAWQESDALKNIVPRLKERHREVCLKGTAASQKKGFNYRRKIFKSICQGCGKEISGFKSSPWREHKFCSKKCSNYYHLSQENSKLRLYMHRNKEDGVIVNANDS